MAYFRSHILVSVDPKCVEKGAYALIDAIQDELVKQGLVGEIQVLETSSRILLRSSNDFMVAIFFSYVSNHVGT